MPGLVKGRLQDVIGSVVEVQFFIFTSAGRERKSTHSEPLHIIVSHWHCYGLHDVIENKWEWTHVSGAGSRGRGALHGTVCVGSSYRLVN